MKEMNKTSENINDEYFGSHVMIDGYGGSVDKLNDPELIKEALEELTKKIGMRKISDPFIKEVSKQSEKDPGGISAFILIAESHITIHTFADRRYLTADVYSCKTRLDKKMIADYLINKFNLSEDIEAKFATRGEQFDTRAKLVGGN